MMSDERKLGGLKARTTDFALRIIRLCATLERGSTEGVIGRQLLRCGTSVGAQYREAGRARSVAEFVSKLESAIQELDETSYWIELLKKSGFIKETRLGGLEQETEALTRMLVASVKTAKKNKEMHG
jgi:four helix bundle protein